MVRGFSTLVACVALTLAAGCGSSSSSTTGSSSTSATKSTTGGGGFKANAPPKFASPASSAPVQGGIVQIAYRNITINPDTLKVRLGSTIRWTNFDAVEHNATSKGGPVTFASKNFGESRTYEVKVTKPGVIHYECTIHPASMNGTIEVVK